MENAVGGGPTGVDLSIPLSCTVGATRHPPLPCRRCVHVRHPRQQWGIPRCARAPRCRSSESFQVFIAKFRERARLYRATLASGRRGTGRRQQPASRLGRDSAERIVTLGTLKGRGTRRREMLMVWEVWDSNG